MSSFPAWLDAPTLLWCAEYCEAMAKRVHEAGVEGAGADVCARGLLQAFEQRRRQPAPARPQLQVVEPTDADIDRSQARMERLFGRAWLEGKE